jgi:hypothetical protein
MAAVTQTQTPDDNRPIVRVIPLSNDTNSLSSRKLRAKVVLPTSAQKHSLFAGDVMQNLRCQIEYAFSMRLLENQEDRQVFKALHGNKAEPWVVDLAKQVVNATDMDEAVEAC